MFLNTTAQESIFYFTNIYLTNVLRYATNNDNAEITMTIEPLPVSKSI